MRAIRTIILRLLIDPEQPHALRGVLHAVEEETKHPFADAPSLLALLEQISTNGIVPTHDNENQGNKPLTVIVHQGE